MKPARQAAALELLSRRNSGIQEVHEFELQHKDGHEIRTLASTNPITDIEGNIVGALAMVTDISGSRRTEQAVKESEERFNKIVEDIQDAVIIHQSGFIIYANPAGARLMGAKNPNELIGRNGVDFTHPDSRGEAVERIQKLMQAGPDGKLPPFRRKVVRLDGKVITVESVGALITFQGRQAMVVIGREVADETAKA
jgi:PAS domain S-box-containing protein